MFALRYVVGLELDELVQFDPASSEGNARSQSELFLYVAVVAIARSYAQVRHNKLLTDDECSKTSA